jgi:hypothetical protein
MASLVTSLVLLRLLQLPFLAQFFHFLLVVLIPPQRAPQAKLSLLFFYRLLLASSSLYPLFYSSVLLIIMSSDSSRSSDAPRPRLPRLPNGQVRTRMRTWVTRDGLTQLFSRFCPERQVPRFNLNHSDSDSSNGGSWDDTVDEDAFSISFGDETIGFGWVEYPDDARNYALYVNRRFNVHATEMEATLNERIAAMEAEILAALAGHRLRASPAAAGQVISACAELRAELVVLFRAHRELFTY